MKKSLIDLLLVGLLIWSAICIKGQESSVKRMILGIGIIAFGTLLTINDEYWINEYIGYIFGVLGLISILLGASKDKD